MDLAQGALGPNGKYDLKFEDGKLVIEANYEMEMAGAGVNVHVGAKQVVEAIKKAIPGQIDDVILDMLLAALEAKK